MRIFFVFLLFIAIACEGQQIIPGAERMDVYVPLLKNKRVAVFANQTSLVAGVSLIDTLLKRGVNVVKIFGPEHGFTGNADAGEKVSSGRYKNTSIPVVSLYGSHNKPIKEDLVNVDVMLFDIQDVGVRFYTFISSLQYYEEAAFENSIPLMILDRPNPNGFYVDGPVLEKKFTSFVGMQEVPVVYGMTIGEYAMMIAGEHWLSEKANQKEDYYLHASNSPDTPFHFLVIKCGNYDHSKKYLLPVKTSPNLPEMQSVYWYPTTCFFEGTVISEGRGTEKPFETIGHPSYPKNMYSFTPVSTSGARDPKFKNMVCHGWNLSGSIGNVLKETGKKIQLKLILEAYRLFADKAHFFTSEAAFNRLAGNDLLIEQIRRGESEEAIRKSWVPGIEKFMVIRKKYLLYKDF